MESLMQQMLSESKDKESPIDQGDAVAPVGEQSVFESLSSIRL